MSAVRFERTGNTGVFWLLFDPDSSTLVAQLERTTRSYTGVTEAEFDRLCRMSADDRNHAIARASETWTEESDRLFNGWFAVIFGGMVADCDSLRLGPRSQAHDLTTLSKLNETERNELLDRDASCSGDVTDHVLVLLPPLEPDSTVLERRAYRLYHVDLLLHSMVPPTPALLYRAA